MSNATQNRLTDVLSDREAIDGALAKAVRDSLLTHARLGRSVPHQLNGQVVWVTPAEIFARYGLDEFGREKPAE
jgi:hypothetical protein